MPARKISAREAVYKGLLRMQQGAYSNLLLDSLLSELDDGRERQFAAQLFYGVLERDVTIRWIIRSLTGKPEKKLDNEVIAALSIALYQIKWMDGVPDSAAVNESVNLIRRSRKKSAAGFVNGVLRSFLRQGATLPLPENPLERAEVEYAMPRWILEIWQRDYGFDTAVKLAQDCLGRPPIQLRVNTLTADREQVMAELAAEGIKVSPHPMLADCLTVSETGSLGRLSAIREGRCYVQDAASQLCAIAVDPRPGETVLDLCAAPGSKSFTMAQLMKDEGRLLSFDLHAHRAELIEEGAKRLGIHCIQTGTGNAAKFDSRMPAADRVLCDVPCAGLGVIRRKPEIRRKSPEEIAGLPAIQLEILHNAANYLRPGGILVYSTCSLNKDENDRVAAAFLAAHPDFAPSALPQAFAGLTAKKGGNTVTLMPHMGGYDGFYIARFIKKRA